VQIFKKIEWLRENFEQIKPIPLTANLAGLYKLSLHYS